jgi:hypothetical protein
LPRSCRPAWSRLDCAVRWLPQAYEVAALAENDGVVPPPRDHLVSIRCGCEGHEVAWCHPLDPRRREECRESSEGASGRREDLADVLPNAQNDACVKPSRARRLVCLSRHAPSFAHLARSALTRRDAHRSGSLRGGARGAEPHSRAAHPIPGQTNSAAHSGEEKCRWRSMR